MESRNTDRKNEEQGACEWDRHRVSTHVEPWMHELQKDMRDHYNTDWDTTVPGKEFNDEMLRIIARHVPSQDEVSELVRAAKSVETLLFHQSLRYDQYEKKWIHTEGCPGCALSERLRAAIAAVEKARKA